MKKEHADHNRDLCDKIIGIHEIASERYNDWVVTTAFYSSIHYVDHKLFPLDHGDDTLSDIEHAKRKLGINSMHMLREQLVTQHLYSIVTPYCYLSKNCRTARYSNYKISDFMAKKSREYLTVIEKACQNEI